MFFLLRGGFSPFCTIFFSLVWLQKIIKKAFREEERKREREREWREKAF